MADTQINQINLRLFDVIKYHNCHIRKGGQCYTNCHKKFKLKKKILSFEFSIYGSWVHYWFDWCL